MEILVTVAHAAIIRRVINSFDVAVTREGHRSLADAMTNASMEIYVKPTSRTHRPLVVPIEKRSYAV